jgi:hypothetical protein
MGIGASGEGQGYFAFVSPLGILRKSIVPVKQPEKDFEIVPIGAQQCCAPTKVRLESQCI